MDLDSSQAPSSSQQVCGNRWEQTVFMLTAARLTMSRALSGNPSIFQKAKQEVINRFITHFAPESVIMNLERTDGLAAVKRVQNATESGMLLVCHHVIYRTLRRAIASFQASKEMQECHEWAFDAKCPRIRIAWKNEKPAHRSIIYKTCKQIEISQEIGEAEGIERIPWN